MRRALARAAAGKSLDVDEVAVLLQAGAATSTGSSSGGAVRDPGLAAAGRPGVVTYAQGVHPADAAVPRPLPLLHVRDRAGAAAAPA